MFDCNFCLTIEEEEANTTVDCAKSKFNKIYIKLKPRWITN